MPFPRHMLSAATAAWHQAENTPPHPPSSADPLMHSFISIPLILQSLPIVRMSQPATNMLNYGMRESVLAG